MFLAVWEAVGWSQASTRGFSAESPRRGLGLGQALLIFPPRWFKNGGRLRYLSACQVFDDKVYLKFMKFNMKCHYFHFATNREIGEVLRSSRHFSGFSVPRWRTLKFFAMRTHSEFRRAAVKNVPKVLEYPPERPARRQSPGEGSQGRALNCLAGRRACFEKGRASPWEGAALGMAGNGSKKRWIGGVCSQLSIF